MMKILAAPALVLACAAIAVPTTDALAKPAARKVVRKAPVKVDWTKRVAVTPEGGFLIGNPAAKAKLIEYGSLTCPYCQRFHHEAIAGIRARLTTGATSFEFRPFAVHSADPILNALLRCAGPARFIRFSDAFFDGQTTLAAAYEAWAEANPATNPNASAADRIKYSDAWGFTAFAATQGLTRAQATACLSNTATFQLQQQREDQANRDFGIAGTPSFVLNGQRLNTYSWPVIDQAIGAVLGS